jgi:hypothetical protein
MHKNARLTPRGRERIVRQGESTADAGGRRRNRRRLPAAARIVAKDWRDCRIVDRFVESMIDLSSR